MIGTPFTYTDIFAELEENTEYDVKHTLLLIKRDKPYGPHVGTLIH